MIVSGYTVGDMVNGNKIIAIWGDVTPVYVLRCGRCNREFTKTQNKMQFYPPKSCGCQIRATHERQMKSCFPRQKRFE